MTHRNRRAWLLVAGAVACLVSGTASGQDLGHRVPASLGLYAGAQQPEGLNISNRLLLYQAGSQYDAQGRRIPGPFLEYIIYNTTGASYTFKLPALKANLTAGFSISFGEVNEIESGQQEIHSGLGDLWVEPLQLGWRWPHADLVAGYAFYAPTGGFNLTGSGGIGLGHWAHEFELGATLYLDAGRTWSISVLATYGLNHKDRGVDLVTGDMVTLESGVGKRLFGVLDLGIASFASWQVRDDRGSLVAADDRGARRTLVAVGPEVDFIVRALSCVITLRYEEDVLAVARARGRSLVTILSFTPWSAPPGAPPESPRPAASPPGGTPAR